MAAQCLTRVKHKHNPASDDDESLHRSPVNRLLEWTNLRGLTGASLSVWVTELNKRLHLSALLINPPPFPLSKSGWISGSQTSSLNCTRSTSGAVLFISFLSLTGRTPKLSHTLETFAPALPLVAARWQAHIKFSCTYHQLIRRQM